MAIETKNFATLVADATAAIQGRSSKLIDFTVGSVLLAIAQAAASVGLWLQSIALQILLVTRASTSTGADLDSFVGDYGLTRDPAVAAIYAETFARFTDTSTAYIPNGTQVQTADGTQTYAVVGDPTNPAYDGSAGYNLPSGTPSVTIPVQNLVGGVGGNVSTGAISVLLTAIPGVDTVNNASGTPTTAGVAAESDAALRIRFQDFLASLASATLTAINTAIDGVQAGLTWVVNPNVNVDNSSHPGYLTIIVDDGSGDPPSSLIAAVAVAVQAVVAEGITFGVFGPSLVIVNYTATLTVLTGFTHSVVVTAIQAAVSTYMQALSLGEGLSYTRMYQVMYDASPGVNELTLLTLNGGVIDIPATGNQVLRAGTGTIS